MANKTIVVPVDQENPKTKYRIMIESDGKVMNARKCKQASAGNKERLEKVAESRNSQERFPDVQYVGTSAEFVNVITSINSGSFTLNKISLTADIDFAGEDVRPICTKSTSSLEINGNGHTIRNMSISTPSIKEGQSYYGLGLIGEHHGPLTVKNLVFDNVHVLSSQREGRANIVGVVAGYVFEDSVFENILVSNSSVKGYGKIGGIIGSVQAAGKHIQFKNCTLVGTTVTGVTNVGTLAGMITRSGRRLTEDVNIVNCNVEGVSFAKAEEWITSSTEYINLDDEINETDCPYLPDNYRVKGEYVKLAPGSETYLYGAFAKYYVSFGNSNHDCVLKNHTEKLANSEVCINSL